jgi:hypothetical protein
MRRRAYSPPELYAIPTTGTSITIAWSPNWERHTILYNFYRLASFNWRQFFPFSIKK